MDKTTLLKNFLYNVTSFLDEEEQLGFLSQENVDKIIIVENLLQAELFSTIEKKHINSKTTEAVTLAYLPFLDDDSDGDMNISFFHKKNELEL